MKAADLRAIVGGMTDSPWFARGRFVSRVRDTTGMGGTLETNHIGNFSEPEDAAGAAALRNHAEAWIDLQEAVCELRAGSGGHVETTVWLAEVLRKLKALEALP